MVVIAAPASRLYVNGLDVSCDLTEMDAEMSTDTQDSTTFCTTVGRTAAAVLQSALFTMRGLASSDIVAGIDVLLSPLLGSSVLATMWPAGDAAGRIGWGGATSILRKWKEAAKVGALVAVSGEVFANASVGGVNLLRSLEPKQQVTGTGAGQDSAVLDNGVATNNGGYAYFQLFAADAATTITGWNVQHSTDNITFVNVATSTLPATAGGSQRVQIVGTINQYVKRRINFTSGKHLTIQTAISRS